MGLISLLIPSKVNYYWYHWYVLYCTLTVYSTATFDQDDDGFSMYVPYERRTWWHVLCWWINAWVKLRCNLSSWKEVLNVSQYKLTNFRSTKPKVKVHRESTQAIDTDTVHVVYVPVVYLKAINFAYSSTVQYSTVLLWGSSFYGERRLTDHTLTVPSSEHDANTLRRVGCHATQFTSSSCADTTAPTSRHLPPPPPPPSPSSPPSPSPSPKTRTLLSPPMDRGQNPMLSF